MHSPPVQTVFEVPREARQHRQIRSQVDLLLKSSNIWQTIISKLYFCISFAGLKKLKKNKKPQDHPWVLTSSTFWFPQRHPLLGECKWTDGDRKPDNVVSVEVDGWWSRGWKQEKALEEMKSMRTLSGHVEVRHPIWAYLSQTAREVDSEVEMRQQPLCTGQDGASWILQVIRLRAPKRMCV